MYSDDLNFVETLLLSPLIQPDGTQTMLPSSPEKPMNQTINMDDFQSTVSDEMIGKWLLAILSSLKFKVSYMPVDLMYQIASKSDENIK